MSELVPQYIQSTLFVALGARTIWAWWFSRDTRSGHLALATGMFGFSQLISAITATLYDAGAGQPAPRWLSILSSIAIYVALHGFILFLADFVALARWLRGITLVATVGLLGLTVIERPDLRFDPEQGIVPIEGVSNPIDYLTFIGYVLAYFAIVFGILWISFAIYGFRQRGIARFRMLSIAGGFMLLFIAVGLLPRMVFGDPTGGTIRSILAVVRYFALGSAPLLFVGFAPPEWVKRRFIPATAGGSVVLRDTRAEQVS